MIKKKKTTSKQSNIILEGREKEQTKPQVRRKEIITIRAKINEIKTKKQQKRPMKLKFNYLKR